MKVVILNGFSALNTGDAAIVLATAGLLRERWPGAEISITSVTPDLDGPFYRPHDIRVLAPILPALSHYAGTARKIAGGARAALAPGPKLALARAIRSADLVLACGGGYLYSNRPFFPGSSFWQGFAHLRFALALGKRLVLLPQSFGPLRSVAARRSLARLFSHPSLVRAFAREETSATLARSLTATPTPTPALDPIAVCPDLALSLEPRIEARSETGPRTTLAVTLREWSFPEDGTSATRSGRRRAYLDAVGRAASRFVRERDGKVIIVPQARGPSRAEDDRAISEEFRAHLGASVPEDRARVHPLPLAASPYEVASVLGRADAVIGTRLHSCILAMLHGTPSIAIGYQPKHAGVLGLLGLDRLCVDIQEASAGALVEMMDEALARREDLRREILAAVAAARLRIRETLFPTLEEAAAGGAS